MDKKTVSSWWFQPIWKICSSNWIISPSRDENQKILELPPPRYNLSNPSHLPFSATSKPLAEAGTVSWLKKLCKSTVRRVLGGRKLIQSSRPSKKTSSYGFNPHGVHGTGIFTYRLPKKSTLNVGKYTIHTWILWDLNGFDIWTGLSNYQTL